MAIFPPMDSPVEEAMKNGFSQSNPDVQPALFWNCLLENTPDGIIFIDAKGTICAWNQTMEMLTGMSESRVIGQRLCPEFIGLTDTFGMPLREGANPFYDSIQKQATNSGNYKLRGRSGRELKVEMKIVPVHTNTGASSGAVIFIHDASSQLDLQRQLKDLYEFSMLDPLTQVANRAEFERSLDQFVRNHGTSDFECCLIICDIDFFKQINDNYNHHVGDQALVAFADLLKQFVRAQDVVARYGGEEFVILCANCDQQAAMTRAEEIRKTLRNTPQPMLDGKYITASFGVSQLQTGESATEFFVRADTALLSAKESGRNRVVAASEPPPPIQAAAKLAETTIASKTDQSMPQALNPSEKNRLQETTADRLNWRTEDANEPLSSNLYRSRTPIPVLVEKLRGYIIETDAEIRHVDTNYACLQVEVEDPHNYTRKGRFEIEVEFQESEDDDDFGRRKYTYLRVVVREGERRWFSTNAIDLAPLVVMELRRYFTLLDEEAVVTTMQPATVHKERHE